MVVACATVENVHTLSAVDDVITVAATEDVVLVVAQDAVIVDGSYDVSEVNNFKSGRREWCCVFWIESKSVLKQSNVKGCVTTSVEKCSIFNTIDAVTEAVIGDDPFNATDPISTQTLLQNLTLGLESNFSTEFAVVEGVDTSSTINDVIATTAGDEVAIRVTGDGVIISSTNNTVEVGDSKCDWSREERIGDDRSNC